MTLDRRLLVPCALEPIDPYLVNLCQTINSKGGETIFSCSGLPGEHPHAPDGRKLVNYPDYLFQINRGYYLTCSPYLTFARNDFGILLFSELEKKLKRSDIILEPTKILAIDHSQFFDSFSLHLNSSSPVSKGEEGLTLLIKNFWSQVYEIVERMC